MGCMPYGRFRSTYSVPLSECFNPSYGLHALRAGLIQTQYLSTIKVSITHMGCMPYGLEFGVEQHDGDGLFQSLIWVACPTGINCYIVHFVHCGFNPSYGLHALRACALALATLALRGFNPSYGLHALRAKPIQLSVGNWEVSIPHMGCMPYGQRLHFP